MVEKAGEELAMKTKVDICDRCRRHRLLTARVRSTMADMKVCSACAIEGVKIAVKYAECTPQGEISVESLGEGQA